MALIRPDGSLSGDPADSLASTPSSVFRESDLRYYDHPPDHHPGREAFETEIYYWLPTTSHVNINVFDIQGRKVAALVSDTQTAGPHWLTWTGRNSDNRPLPSGLYFSRLETGGRRLTRKLLLLR